MKNYLIYLATGSSDYLNEALYSLISFYRFHAMADQIHVLIYTDNADYFRMRLPPGITYRELDATIVDQWKGSLGYVYRLKTKVLQEVCALHEGNFLFVDTDTVFLKDILPIFEAIERGQLFLDACEGRLIDNKGGIAKKTRRFLRRQSIFSVPADADPIYIDSRFVAWNSGTIGFSDRVCDIFPAVEQLIDELYAKSKGKVFVVEQLALSYYFQQKGAPQPTENFIHHYWDFKEFRPILSAFLDYHKSKPLSELIDLFGTIHPLHLASEKRKYKKLSFLEKQWRKITTGRKWKMPKYSFV